MTPGIRQPVQWIIAGVISTPFNSDQSSATFCRSGKMQDHSVLTKEREEFPSVRVS